MRRKAALVALSTALLLATAAVASAVAAEAVGPGSATAGGSGASSADTALYRRRATEVPGRVAAASASTHQISVAYASSNHGLRPVQFTAYQRVHYYKIPVHPIGTVVFFPGCARSSRTFWPWDPEHCPDCQGFPEEVAMAKNALARGYAVLTPTAKAKNTCWSSGGYYKDNDQSQVMSIVSDFMIEHGLDRKPLYFAGSSSGATFALKLPAYLMRFIDADRSVCSNGKCRDPYARWELPSKAKLRMLQLRLRGIVSVGSTPAGDDWGVLHPNTMRLAIRPYPPVVWVALANDDWGPGQAPKNTALLRRNKVASTYVVAQALRITDTFFSKRSAVITSRQSSLIVDALHDIGLLDSKGRLRDNPKNTERPWSRAYEWPQRLVQKLPWLTLGASPTFSLEVSRSIIFQELNRAYAFHENVADYFLASLMYLESGGRANMRQLARRQRQFTLAHLTAARYYPRQLRNRGI